VTFVLVVGLCVVALWLVVQAGHVGIGTRPALVLTLVAVSLNAVALVIALAHTIG